MPISGTPSLLEARSIQPSVQQGVTGTPAPLKLSQGPHRRFIRFCPSLTCSSGFPNCHPPSLTKPLHFTLLSPSAPMYQFFIAATLSYHKPSRLKQHRFILTSPDIHSGFHWAKIKLSTELPSIYKLQRRIHFLALPSSWRLLTFLGSWPLPSATACHSILCISHLIAFSD